MAIGTRLTLAGAKLLAKAMQGKQLLFTRGAFGDAKVNGQLVEPTSAEQDALTALIHEKISLPIYYYEFGDNGDLIVAVKVTNNSLTADFKAAEAGLFAQDPDTGAEILYGYCYEGNDGDMIHAKSSHCVLEYYVELTTTIGNAKYVTCNVNIKEKIKAGDGLSRVGDTLNVNTGTGLSLSADNNVNLKRATDTEKGGVIITGNNGLVMDGDTLKAIGGETDLESRLKQLEINQSNLFMKLNADNALGATANLLLVEDFVKCKCVDSSSGSCFINWDAVHYRNWNPISDKAFARIGRYYTLTCLDKETEILITDVIDSNNQSGDQVYAFYFDGDVDDWASLDDARTTKSAKIFRTSAAVIKGQYAYGPGDLHSNSRNASWSGRISTTTKTATLPTDLHHEDDFNISANGALTSDGYFTIN